MAYPLQHRRVAVVIFVAICALVGGAVWLVHRISHPSPAVIGRLASPDGRLELVIVETLPQGMMMQSPYRYDVSVVDRRSGPMGGVPLHIDNDSSALQASDFTADWVGRRVTLTWCDRFHASTDLIGAQSWATR